MQYKAQIFWINPSEERSYWGVYNDMIEDWRSLSWIRNSALWSISFRLRRIDHQQDSWVINWDGLFIQESQWGRTYCGETPQYEQHWNVKSIWKQSGCWLRKIVWTMMKDKKESFMNRNPSEERPTVDKGQNSWMIDWDVLFGNNQAADWGRLFGQWWRTKRSLSWMGIPVRKDLLWIKDKIVGWSIEMGYLETIRLPIEEDCLTWWRTKRSLSWTRTCCEEAPQHIWYKEVRTPNEADDLKDQIAN